jgi:hypothetical protein
MRDDPGPLRPDQINIAPVTSKNKAITMTSIWSRAGTIKGMMAPIPSKARPNPAPIHIRMSEY